VPGPAPLVPEYALARDAILTGDVLLFRGRGTSSRLIAKAGRSDYSHAALALRIRDRVLVAESREPGLLPPRAGGCRLLPLSSALRAAESVDVFRLATPEVAGARDLALADEAQERLEEEAFRHLGQPYGLGTILRIAAGRLLLPLALLPGRLGAWARTRSWYSTDDLLPSGPAMICSEYVARCFGAAGVDLVPRLSNRDTEPADLGRSALLRPVVTILGGA
jgi:hypothetical protein